MTSLQSVCFDYAHWFAMHPDAQTPFDLIAVGSGFGAILAAYVLEDDCFRPQSWRAQVAEDECAGHPSQTKAQWHYEGLGVRDRSNQIPQATVVVNYEILPNQHG